MKRMRRTTRTTITGRESSKKEEKHFHAANAKNLASRLCQKEKNG